MDEDFGEDTVTPRRPLPGTRDPSSWRVGWPLGPSLLPSCAGISKQPEWLAEEGGVSFEETGKPLWTHPRPQFSSLERLGGGLGCLPEHWRQCKVGLGAGIRHTALTPQSQQVLMRPVLVHSAGTGSSGCSLLSGTERVAGNKPDPAPGLAT